MTIRRPSRESHTASDAYHESIGLLTEHTRNMHRAIVGLEEELEAFDSVGREGR